MELETSAYAAPMKGDGQWAWVLAHASSVFVPAIVLGKLQRRPIPRNDVWIAASALENGCRLLTLDAHFREIPVLVLEP
jgi:hypothetical protein